MTNPIKAIREWLFKAEERELAPEAPVTLADAVSAMEAERIRRLLADNGIEAHVNTEFSPITGAENVQGGSRVSVRYENLEAARDLLRD